MRVSKWVRVAVALLAVVVSGLVFMTQSTDLAKGPPQDKPGCLRYYDPETCVAPPEIAKGGPPAGSPACDKFVDPPLTCFGLP